MTVREVIKTEERSLGRKCKRLGSAKVGPVLVVLYETKQVIPRLGISQLENRLAVAWDGRVHTSMIIDVESEQS